MYLTLESESDHGDTTGEPTYVYEADEDERLELARRLLLDNAQGAARAVTSGVTQHLICSCGSFKCPSIKIYGLPQAVYEAEIRGLPDQGARDRRARELRS